MQAVKEKLHDMNELRKAKAGAKEEEKAEKEMAKARLEVAREARLAKEAEAAMNMHVEKAAEKAAAASEEKDFSRDASGKSLGNSGNMELESNRSHSVP